MAKEREKNELIAEPEDEMSAQAEYYEELLSTRGELQKVQAELEQVRQEHLHYLANVYTILTDKVLDDERVAIGMAASAADQMRKRAEAAEQSRERMREALEKAFAGMKAVSSLVAFYTRREMNAPANNQEAVRDARENEAVFDNGMEEARKALEGER